MTCVFVTFDSPPNRPVSDALRERNVTLAQSGLPGGVELYQGDLGDSPEWVDAWLRDVLAEFGGDGAAVLVAHGHRLTLTTVIVDGETVSHTRADEHDVFVDDFLEEAA